MQKRLKFTPDMIHAALDKGWNVSQTARHYGTHPSSISAAAARFGIPLPKSKFSPTNVSERHIALASDERIKVFSASPDAIARALSKLETTK
jgi:precorrin-6B methylase 1